MAAFSITGFNGGSFGEDYLHPGDTFLSGEMINAVSGAAAVTLGASNLLGGVLLRSGAPGAGFSDILDNASNILNQLSAGDTGNQPQVQKGTSFKLRILNNTGQIQTLTVSGGSGVSLGTGTFTTPAGYWREYLFTVLSVTLPDLILCNMTSGSPNVYFALNNGQASYPILPAGGGLSIDIGATTYGGISGTVTGLIHGQGGLIGFVNSTNAAANTSGNVSFLPSIKVDSIGSGPV